MIRKLKNKILKFIVKKQSVPKRLYKRSTQAMSLL